MGEGFIGPISSACTGQLRGRVVSALASREDGEIVSCTSCRMVQRIYPVKDIGFHPPAGPPKSTGPKPSPPPGPLPPPLYPPLFLSTYGSHPRHKHFDMPSLWSIKLFSRLHVEFDQVISIASFFFPDIHPSRSLPRLTSRRSERCSPRPLGRSGQSGHRTALLLQASTGTPNSQLIAVLAGSRWIMFSVTPIPNTLSLKHQKVRREFLRRRKLISSGRPGSGRSPAAAAVSAGAEEGRS